jgi:hypothetical protein
MGFLAKNSWLNFLIGLTGFYFVFSVIQIIMGKFGTKVVATTLASNNFSGNYYWLIAYGITLVIALVLVIIFCKPRTPFFVFLGILLGGAVGLYHPLYITLINLDINVRKEGLVALYELLPHLVVLVGALIAFYIAWLSNRISGTNEQSN